jgi:lysophospholipase L1-like esterase
MVITRSKLLLLLCLLLSISASAQQSDAFAAEVTAIKFKYANHPKGGVVFTGSSSIRLWHSLEEDFPHHLIINSGFGGSQTHQLIQHLDELVLAYEPEKIFVYEGDNDINAGKPVKTIIDEFKKLNSRIKEKVPEAELFIISAKPSPSRWHLKKEYETLNKELEKFSDKNKKVTFVDVWTPMLDDSGKPEPSLFIDDALHMNDKGYLIWKNIISKYF